MSALTTLRELLPEARTHHRAVPGFDCVSDVYIRAILETAQEERSPVVLMALGRDLAGRGVNYIAGLVRAVAPCYDIPIVLHLDHATDIQSVCRAIDHGFSSVMFDGSAMPYAQNVDLSARAVQLARPHGVSVEAELGCVAGSDLGGQRCGQTVLTRPDEVVAFVKATGVDALAVSIGTEHGVYAAAPQLDIERLKAIDAVSPVPLVMHGGSGTPEDQVRAAIRNGITKFNVYADCRLAVNAGFAQACERVLRRPDELPDIVFQPLYAALAAQVRAKIRLAGSGANAATRCADADGGREEARR